MKTHQLKTDPTPFRELWKRLKTCEVRNCAGRSFRVGDHLELCETEYSGEDMSVGSPLTYTGRMIKVLITHMQKGYDLPEKIVVLSFREIERLEAPDAE